MRPDSSAIANALIAKLGADTELLALVPDNVHEDMGPPAAKRFVVVSQIIATDQAVLHQGRVIEDVLFLVEARVLKGTGPTTACAAAAARIDALLDDGTMTVPGYRITQMFREEFIRGTEIDEGDASIVWKRRGGRYRVTAYRELVASVVAAESLLEVHAGIETMRIALWFDGPVKLGIPWQPGDPFPDITITALSSNLLVAPNFTMDLNPYISEFSVSDSSAPGRAKLVFQRGTDMRTWGGLTFTISDASPRHNWALILNRETGAPVADTLGDLVLTIPILP